MIATQRDAGGRTERVTVGRRSKKSNRRWVEWRIYKDECRTVQCVLISDHFTMTYNQLWIWERGSTVEPQRKQK